MYLEIVNNIDSEFIEECKKCFDQNFEVEVNEEDDEDIFEAIEKWYDENYITSDLHLSTVLQGSKTCGYLNGCVGSDPFTFWIDADRI